MGQAVRSAVLTASLNHRALLGRHCSWPCLGDNSEACRWGVTLPKATTLEEEAQVEAACTASLMSTWAQQGIGS